MPAVADQNGAAYCSDPDVPSENKAKVNSESFSENMEAFLKTGKVGANPGGSTSKPASKTKGEKKQGPVGCSQPFSWVIHMYQCKVW